MFLCIYLHAVDIAVFTFTAIANATGGSGELAEGGAEEIAEPLTAGETTALAVGASDPSELSEVISEMDTVDDLETVGAGEARLSLTSAAEEDSGVVKGSAFDDRSSEAIVASESPPEASKTFL